MRLFEALFIVAELASVIGWMALKARLSIKLLLTLLPVPFGVLQLALEGYRAQMLPAYLFAFGLLGYGLWQWKKPAVSGRKRKRWLSVLAGIAAGLYVLVMVSLPLLFPVFQLEKPTGPYAVGMTNYSWSYSNTSPEASYAQRTLLIQCWYPAERSGTAPTVPYATPEQLERAAAETGTPAWLVDSLRLVQTETMLNAPVAQTQPTYPVILFVPGENVPVLSYTGLMQELASHGFILVSLNAGDLSLAAGKQITSNVTLSDQVVNDVWVPEIRFVLDQLEIINQNPQAGKRLSGRLDLQRVGILGHSIGGAAATMALLQDARLKAGINMDGAFFGAGQVTAGVPKPFMLMDSSHSKQGYSAQELGVSAQEYQQLQAVFARKARVLQHGGYELTLAGAEHLSFSDFYLYSPLFALAIHLSPQQAQQIISAYAEAFFGQALNGSASPLLTTSHQPFSAATLVHYS
jgi:predicted dienelactone hydrolase